MEWIKTSESLPEYCQDILFHVKAWGIERGYFRNGTFEKSSNFDTWYPHYVDYWMPIPPLPKEGAK